MSDFSNNEMTILFTGDACSCGRFELPIKNGQSIFGNDLKHLLLKQDFVITNLEGPATQEDNINNSFARIVSEPTFISFLSSQNIKYYNLANNHILDCGVKGLEDSIKNIQSNDGYYLGAGMNEQEAKKELVLKKNDLSIGIFSSSYKDAFAAKKDKAGVSNFSNPNEILKKAKALKREHQFVIFNYHGDGEFVQYPLPQKRKFLKSLCDSSIDFIICHHPHVIQGMEEINGTKIFYSLGNFVFDSERQSRFSYTDIGILLKLKITHSNVNWEVIPVIKNLDKAIVQLYSNKFDFGDYCDFKNYKKNWRMEGARVFKEDKLNRNTGSQTSSSESNSTKTLPKVFRLTFYKAIFSALANPHYRPIFFAYLCHIVLRDR